jgi:ketosteroid isomerase-like protein
MDRHPAEPLMEADRAFCRDVQENGAEAWASWFAEDGVQFPASGRVEGRDAIRALMTPVFAPGAPALLWEPTDAVLTASGELGYTLGKWRLVAAEGDSVLGTGNYVTIWRRIDGEWKVVVDIGNSDPEE